MGQRHVFFYPALPSCWGAQVENAHRDSKKLSSVTNYLGIYDQVVVRSWQSLLMCLTTVFALIPAIVPIFLEGSSGKDAIFSGDRSGK